MVKVNPDPAGRFPRTAVASDVLDSLDRTQQCLGWDIAGVNTARPLTGRAYPVSCRAVSTRPDEPYQGLLAALDGIRAGEVFIVPTGRTAAAAVWGELVTTACLAQGAAGALTDGLVRDSRRLAAIGDAFPVYARGTIPYDVAGRLDVGAVTDVVSIDGVRIERGDLVLADEDGVVIVPRALEAEVLRLAAQKTANEDRFRAAVADGMPPSQAYRAFGVL